MQMEECIDRWTNQYNLRAAQLHVGYFCRKVGLKNVCYMLYREAKIKWSPAKEGEEQRSGKIS